MTRPSNPRFCAARRALSICATALVAATAFPAAGQPGQWPTKPVRIVVGFAPGGGTDVIARIVAQSLTESLGQPFIVDNKPGASGNLSAAEVARAAGDGYTFVVAPTSVETANPSLFKSSVLPSRDLAPVMALGRMQMYLLARPTLEVKDARQVLPLLKSQPGKFNFASSGTGTPPHLAIELFKQSTGADIVHVPYHGSAPALQDVMASQADFVFDPGIGFPHIRSGKVKLLAVASDRKSPFFPDAPTYADMGIKNAAMDVWFGLWAPHKVPAEIMERLSRELAKALAAHSLQQRFGDQGVEAVPLDTAAFRKLLVEEGRTLSTLGTRNRGRVRVTRTPRELNRRPGPDSAGRCEMAETPDSCR